MSEPRDTSAPASTEIAEERSKMWPPRLWIAGRVVATLGAVVFAPAAWGYWANVSDATHTLRLSPGDVEGFPGGFAWAALSIVGILLLPFLWLRMQPLLMIGATGVFLLWSAVGSYAAWTAIQQDLGRGTTITLVDNLKPHTLLVTEQAQIRVSYYVGIAAVAVAVLGSVLVGIALTRFRDLPQRTIAPRSRAALPGARALTFALVLYIGAVLALGWATVNCTATPLLVGSCLGLSFSSVLRLGMATNTDLFDPVAGLHAIPLLLVGGAILIVVGLWWWRRLTAGLCFWITVWLAAATFCLVIADLGVGAVIADPTALNQLAGTWSGQTGIPVAALGLLIGWIADIFLWVGVFRAPKSLPASVSASQ